VDAVEPQIRELLRAYPTMPASVIAERIGWTRGKTVFADRVRELRPVYAPPDPASRTGYPAGEIAQHDLWFPDIELPVGFGQTRTAKQLPVLTMVSGYSRWLSAVLIPSRRAEDLFAGWWRLIDRLGAVPRVLVWDGEGAIGRWRDDTGGLTLRVHGRLHHIGIGRTHARTHIIMLVDDLHVRVINAITGELLRELTIDPTRDYQPRGLPPGPQPKHP
jgi:transposase